MNFIKYVMCLLVLMLSCSFPARDAAAAVQLTVMPSGNNVFVLQGKGLDGIAALDFQFYYDPEIMANPKGSRGNLIPGDAIFNFNSSVPGEVRLFIRIATKAVSGSGILATISFDGIGEEAGTLLSLSANLVSVKATPVIADVQILRKSAPPVETQQPIAAAPVETGVATTSATAGGAAPVSSGGTVAGGAGAARGNGIPASAVVPRERAETDQDNPGDLEGQVSATEGEEPQPTERTAIPVEPHSSNAESSSPPQVVKTIVYQSVLERMKTYTGERTPAALSALFNPVAGQIVYQDPPIVISDGVSAVTLRVTLPPTFKDTPGFAFRNANMVSLDQDDDGSWVIDLLPRKNTIEARVTISSDGNEFVYPLVVSPPVDPGLLTLDGSPEAAFDRFLAPGDTAREPRFDLNGDGRFDYLDDYIFTVHYLAARQKATRKVPGEKRQ